MIRINRNVALVPVDSEYASSEVLVGVGGIFGVARYKLEVTYSLVTSGWTSQDKTEKQMENN